MTYLDIDIESRSRVDLGDCGLKNYVEDESTRILCIVFSFEGKIYRNDLTALRLLASRDDVVFVAHNVAFEYLMLHKFLPWFNVPISRWRCTMAVARYHSAPGSLGGVALFFDLEGKKDEVGKIIMLMMCKPFKKTKKSEDNEVCSATAEYLEELFGLDYNDPDFILTHEVYKKLVVYCVDDVIAEEGIRKHLGLLPPQEQEVWELDFQINWFNGAPVDIELCEKAIAAFGKIQDTHIAQCQDEFGFTPTQVAKVKAYLGTEDTTASTLKVLAADPNTPPDKLRLIDHRQIVGNTTPSKYAAIMRMAHKGRVYGMLTYYGASTGRWSSRGVQLQNMYRGDLSEDWVDEEMEVFCSSIIDNTMGKVISSGLAKDEISILKSSIRGAFTGFLRVCDYAQIEARVLPWIAEEHSVLQSFRDGLDLYKFTAAQIYRKPYEEITKKERFIGKIATLALGYQGGAGAFLAFAKNFGVEDISVEFADEIKTTWRNANQNIVNFWYGIEDAAKMALRGRPTTCGPVTARYRDDFLTIELPSGRELFYPYPELHTHPKFTNKKSLTFRAPVAQVDLVVPGTKKQMSGVTIGQVYTHGGRLTENIVQAISRDVLAEAMLRVPKESILFHVHDELVCQGIPMAKLRELMLVQPQWAEGLPLGAEGWTGKRYRK